MSTTKSYLLLATNMLGHLKPDVIERLKAVIDNPCQETWEDTYTIIVSNKGRMKTLWNAVLDIDPNMPRGRSMDSPWTYIPSSEIIEQAIKNVVLENVCLS